MLDTLAAWSTGLLALLGVVIAYPGRTQKPATADKRTAPPSTQSGNVRLSGVPLSAAQQFAKIGHVIGGAVLAASQIGDMHEKARIQLEVVEFTVDRLLEDLADVMALPPSLMARTSPAMATVAAVRRAA